MDATDAAHAAAAAAARASYGRLVALLAYRWRDIAAAEDALSEAFATALATWPRDGVPASPEAWLMTASKRHLLKAARRQRLADDPELTVLFAGADVADTLADTLPDRRLALMFACAHPAIDRAIRPALMLKTILGLDAARIATAFVVAPDTMTKRLVRAKAKIRAAGIRFEVPDPDQLPNRVDAVLEAIYGAYGLHWNQPVEELARELADEALFLAELVAAQLPSDAEAQGLLALLLLAEARGPARLDDQGVFVPLDRQDATHWDAAAIERGNGILARAAALREPGPLQLEAAIQAAHCARARTGRTAWADIVVLYERLLASGATIGVRIAYAVALAQSTGSIDASLAMLDGMDGARMAGHQSWWAARAHLFELAGQEEAARSACARALALTEDPAWRRHLEQQLGR